MFHYTVYLYPTRHFIGDEHIHVWPKFMPKFVPWQSVSWAAVWVGSSRTASKFDDGRVPVQSSFGDERRFAMYRET